MGDGTCIHISVINSLVWKHTGLQQIYIIFSLVFSAISGVVIIFIATFTTRLNDKSVRNQWKLTHYMPIYRW